MRRDIASAYAAATGRIVSWIVISALVYRRDGAGAFAMLALVRATIGLLNYTTIGLAPAMIHLLPRVAYAADRAATGAKSAAEAFAPFPVLPERVGVSVPPLAIDSRPQVLSYAGDRQPDASVPVVYCNGIALAWAASLVAMVLLVAYAFWFQRRHGAVPGVSLGELRLLLLAMGIGTILRLASDPASALLQVRGRIALDNLLLTGTEILWTALVLLSAATLPQVGSAFALCSALLLLARSAWGYRLAGVLVPSITELRPALIRALLAFGATVTLAQVADYLYAPTDYILIDRLLRPIDVATYAPAVQIDGGVLVLVTALAAVVLAKASVAHAAGDHATIRRYYVTGTLASFALLSIVAFIVWLFAPEIFRLWLGNPMPLTQAILPLVLINTVIGGSSAVGRSILIGAGRVKPFAASVLVAGFVNVICSYCFVRYAHAGLRGIVLGTSVAVLGRCLIWMPWYVLRTLHRFQISTVPRAFENAGI